MVLVALTLIIAPLTLWACTTTRSLSVEPQKAVDTRRDVATDSDLSSSPCRNALALGAMCSAANKHVLEVMSAHRVKAVVVMQDVQTGALVAFAASHPTELDVTTSVSPLSLSKVLLAASWWNNQQPDFSFDSTKGNPTAANPAFRSRVTIHEMLVGGSDSAGRQAAIALRKSIGTKKALEDFQRYGFGQRNSSLQDDKFWAELAPSLRERLTPGHAYASLSEQTKDEEWAETLSLGEINMGCSALHLSRFFQAIGNNGAMVRPAAREEQSTPVGSKGEPVKSIRIMQESAALKLQSAMRDTVQRGTARSIAKSLEASGWQIGGKTGSGLALLPKGDLVDGWFAGLIFDPRGKARFTVATFVRSGGYGGENAAKISAAIAGYIIGQKN